MHRRMLFLSLFLVTAAAPAQIPFPRTPDWISSAGGNYSTGLACVDIDRDGRLDLVVSNGNDMARRHLAVYYRDSGGFPATPQWESQDVDYHGHCSVADVNGDGWPDVAVSVYLGAGGFGQRGYVKLYQNNNGRLSDLPVWRSDDSMFTFSCAFGDADRDGRPDLAVACGEAYDQHPEQERIYFNGGNYLHTLPGWTSTAAGYSTDVAWTDIDNNGTLDLVFAGELGAVRLYRHDFGGITRDPVWQSADAPSNANSLATGDVDGDGFDDLVVSDNNQLGGSGRFKLYRNRGGTLDSLPAWTSAFSGMGSGITLADVDGDGDRDLITGGWWQPLRIYRNTGGSFPAQPDWSSSTGSVVEAIVAADLDGDGRDTVRYRVARIAGSTLVRLPRAPVEEILDVRLGPGLITPPGNWCADPQTGWISIAPSALHAGSVIDVDAVVSGDPDLAVTNWDSDLGNYVFYNTTPPTGTLQPSRIPTPSPPRFFPQPFRGQGRLELDLERRTLLGITVYDMLGRPARVLPPVEAGPGAVSLPVSLPDLPRGMYLLEAATESAVAGRVLLAAP